jgi:hypothetical protein
MLGMLDELRRSLLLAFAACIFVSAISIFVPNKYRSSAQLLPVDGKGGMGSLQNLAAAAAVLGVNVPGGDAGDGNFLDIINSRWLQERLLTSKFSFHERGWLFGAPQAKTQTLIEYLHAKNEDIGLARLRPIISAGRDPKTKVLTLSAETKSPELSQALVEKTLALLEEFVQEKGRTRGGAKAVFAAARLKESRAEMARCEEEFLRFLEANRSYLTSQDPSVRLKGMRLEAELKLRQQLTTTLALNREQALLEEKNDIPVLSILDEGNYPIEKSGPSRSIYVIATFLISMVAHLSYLNRARIRSLLMDQEDPRES